MSLEKFFAEYWFPNDKYLLVRPYPSLRIVFVSPALRIPGLLQSPFLPHIGGPQHVRDGLYEAFEQGAAVTAKVTWLPNGHSSTANGTSDGRKPHTPESRAAAGNRRPPPLEAKTRYISCTPLLGSDDRVGVWMVVMVENETVTGGLASRERNLARYNGDVPVPPTPSEYEREDGYANSADEGGIGRRNGGIVKSEKRGKVGSEGGRLYAEYMRESGNATQNSNKPGSEHGQLDGLADEERVQEVFTPVEERRNIF